MNWIKRLAISVPIALVLAYVSDKLTLRTSCACDPATMDCAKICAVPLEADIIGTVIYFAIFFPIVLGVLLILEKLYSLITKQAKK